jgi:transcriptional regulator with XRE-family HTH domain
LSAVHVAQKFERLLEAHRRPDGHRWTGQRLEEATGGVVTRSYFTNLRKGRIESPGYEKMAAIAKAMGFPPEEWFSEGNGRLIESTDEGRGIAGRVEHLFETFANPKTGRPYTNAEAARMTLGDLSEEDVEGIRTGAVADPTVGQVQVLASAFGVEPSYLLNRGEPSLLDEELVRALRDKEVRDITRESSRLPDGERRLLLAIVRQFRDQKAEPSGSN